MKKIIIILGMHRSGTSLLAQILARMGVYFGKADELIAGDKSNEEGHYEYREIVDAHDDVLYSMGKSWCSIDIDTSMVNTYFSVKHKQLIDKSIKRLFSSHDVVAIKDPRLAYFVPCWEEMLKDMGILPIYLYVIRNPDEVSASLKKRNGIPLKHGIHMWEFYNALIQKFLIGKEALCLSFDNLFSNGCYEHIYNYLVTYGISVNNDCEKVARIDLRHNVMGSSEENATSFDARLYDRKATEVELAGFIHDCIESKSSNIHVKDYDLLNNNECDCLNGRNIVIYGAGDFGRKAASLLNKIGITSYSFCDRDSNKVGTSIDGIRIEGISELEKKTNLTIIIAIENQRVVRQLKYFFTWISDAYVISLFALQRFYGIRYYNHSSIESQLDIMNSWYKELERRTESIKNALSKNILIYQNGKVGSSSLYGNLINNGVDCAHIHRLFFYNDLVRQLKYGDDMIFEMASFSENNDYKNAVGRLFEGKKIITLVRDPISVDLSTIFQWFDYGGLDRYLNRQFTQGYTFLESMRMLSEKTCGRMLNWFREELEPATGINIFSYGFDKEKGFSWIRHEETELLVVQTEKLDSLYTVIEEFLDAKLPDIKTYNIGMYKSYSDIYSKTKADIVFSSEYIDYYYSENDDLQHFYSMDDIYRFKKRWKIE